MKISLSSLCIITLLLCSCTAKKTDDAYYDYYNDDKNYISTSRVRPVFYSSGFAAEGNDYYYISKSKHKLKEVEDRVYQTPSVPSRYIVDIDAKWQSLFGFVIEGAKERGIKKNISTPVIDRFLVKLYDIETKELVKTVNVKKLIKNIDEDISIIDINTFETTAIEGEPYFLIRVEDIIQSTEEYSLPNIRWLCVNLDTEEYIIKPRPPYEFVKARYFEVAIFNERFNFWQANSYGIPYKGRLFVHNLYYWQGCRDISFDLYEVPVNNEKLYSKFPTLKEDLEKLKEEGKDALVHIILTDNPSYDEIASYMAEGDYKPTFEGMIVWDNESIDGEKHKVHSAEEWYEYYKYYKPEDLIPEWMSPILPREPKY